MKVNNPNEKRGVFKLGEYNESPIYYSHAQKEDELLVGRLVALSCCRKNKT